MIPAVRVEEIRSALAAAGPDWPAAAKQLPEVRRVSTGIPSGPGMHRPHVWLTEEIEGRLLMPPRLVLHENGTWFLLGERPEQTTHRRTGWQPKAPRFGSSTRSGS